MGCQPTRPMFTAVFLRDVTKRQHRCGRFNTCYRTHSRAMDKGAMQWLRSCHSRSPSCLRIGSMSLGWLRARHTDLSSTVHRQRAQYPSPYLPRLTLEVPLCSLGTYSLSDQSRRQTGNGSQCDNGIERGVRQGLGIKTTRVGGRTTGAAMPNEGIVTRNQHSGPTGKTLKCKHRRPD